MSRDVISAKLDIIFKKLFSENEDLLHDFLASILEIPNDSIKKIKIINPELSLEAVENKFSRLDLNMMIDDKLVNVEIQIYNDPDYRDRALFYWAKLYTSELKSGDSYSMLKQAITVNIINFNMFESTDYHTEVAAMIKGTGEVYSDKFKMHFFELKKVDKRLNKDNRRELWLQFINADSEEEFDMLSQTNVPVIQKAVQVIYDMSEDAKIRENARIREKALHDEASLMQGAERKGRTEERAEIIESLKAYGMTDEQIKEALSLNKENR
ncbi:MAG: Rpn family recombination-promoting nuclease/putative transposase [Alistipes senegalensis]|nr:Rpn family recombination-promoting nuclease/putative transposase [Alistipes senegalensis]